MDFPLQRVTEFLFVVHQVLVFAAQELSRPTVEQREPSAVVTPIGSSDLSPNVSDKPADWRQEVEKRIQSKTRRLRKVSAAGRYLSLLFVAFKRRSSTLCHVF